MNAFSSVIHPGEILLEEFLLPMAIDKIEFACKLGLTPDSLFDLLSGRIDITDEIASRLAHYFCLPKAFWVGLQEDYDERVAACPVGAAS